METNNNKIIQIIILSFCCFCSCFTKDIEENTIRIALKTKPDHLAEIRKSLNVYNFKHRGKINDNLFIFYKIEVSETPRHLQTGELEVLRKSNHYIEELDQSLLFYPESPVAAQTVSYEQKTEEKNFMHVCPPFFDEALGIDRTWSLKNYTGKGVVFGVTDVGINTENIQLKQNINRNLSYNFADDQPETNPTHIWEIIESKRLTSHGNGCAGLIAGARTTQRCDACGVGVSYNSKVADLQIAKIEKRFWKYPKFDTALYAAALAYKPDEIHIYSNSWGVKKPFHTPMFWEDDVLTEGMLKGRHGLGSVYVFPAVSPGAAFSNHIATVTVACLGLDGAVHEVSEVNSAALVSVFCNGRSRSESRMVTVGHSSDSCLTEFGGESAGVAIVSGMIGLLLESNPMLSSRDVKHILVMSSRHTGLEASPEFVQNAAGYMYHPKLGFGYPNAMMMVSIGSNYNSLPPLCKMTLEIARSDLQIRSADMYERMSYVDTFCDKTTCIEKMEEVVFEVNFTYSEQHSMKLSVVSPNGTISTLAETKSVLNPESSRQRVQANFRINHFWGENSAGRWRIYISCNISKNNEYAYYDCHIAEGKLVVYGVKQKRQFGHLCQTDPSLVQAVVNKTLNTTIVNNFVITPTTFHEKTMNNMGVRINVTMFCVVVVVFTHVYNFKMM